MKAKNAAELIKLLNEHRVFISTLFDSSGHQMHLNSVIGAIGINTFTILEEYEIVETFNNEVILDDKIASMLEAHLIDGYDEDILDYAKIFKNIHDNINLYYKAFENGDDTSRYIRDIQRRLKKIPNNLRDNLIGIQRHVEFVYRSATSPQQKVQELSIHNESIRSIEERITYIRSEMIKIKGFVSSNGDSSLQFYQNRLQSYLQDAANTLIRLNTTVVEYIRKTNENIRFYRHLVELTDLAKCREIVDKTNIYELVTSPKRSLYHSGYTSVERMNWQLKLKPDFEYGELEKLLMRCDKPIEALGKATASSEAIIIPDKDDEVEVISAGLLLDGYLMGESLFSLHEYLSLQLNDISEETMLELYLSAMVIGEKSLDFSNDALIDIGKYYCLSAVKKYT